ncbi:unnamed protein product, partial [marine sediment metagenome]
MQRFFQGPDDLLRQLQEDFLNTESDDPEYLANYKAKMDRL